MWQGMGNLDMAMVLRHSQKKWRETGLPCLRFWHHPLTLPWKCDKNFPFLPGCWFEHI
jgi:hypothetical protein